MLIVFFVVCQVRGWPCKSSYWESRIRGLSGAEDSAMSNFKSNWFDRIVWLDWPT